NRLDLGVPAARWRGGLHPHENQARYMNIRWMSVPVPNGQPVGLEIGVGGDDEQAHPSANDIRPYVVHAWSDTQPRIAAVTRYSGNDPTRLTGVGRSSESDSQVRETRRDFVHRHFCGVVALRGKILVEGDL